jgi:hypothetical protein
MSYHPPPTALVNPGGECSEMMVPPRIHRGERPATNPDGPVINMQVVAVPGRCSGKGATSRANATPP